MDPFSKSPIGIACLDITQQLIAHPMSESFRNIRHEGYLQHVKNHVDLNMIKKRLKNNNYASYSEWERDIRLVFENSIEYNGADSIFGGLARYMLKKAEKMMRRIRLFNQQNYEEYFRSVYRELAQVTSQLTGKSIKYVPKYDIMSLGECLNAVGDSAEAEQIIRKNGDERILKKAKDGVVNLDHLSRKTLDALHMKFGK